MLLFTKREHSRQLRAGRKSVELRAGSRYRKVQPGDRLSINGHFNMIVIERFILNTESELLAFLRREFRSLGFNSFDTAHSALVDCYGAPQFPMFAWWVEIDAIDKQSSHQALLFP